MINEKTKWGSEMERPQNKKLTAVDWLIAGVLAVVAAILYFASLANYIYPGESARLSALWNGLDASTFTMYPLAKAFAGLFGYGNLFAPICGALSVAAIYLVVSFFVCARTSQDDFAEQIVSARRLGGVIAAVVFMLTPAVREAATHLEPRLFDILWVLLATLLLPLFARAPKFIAWAVPLVLGVMMGLGLADSPLFLLLLPFFFMAVWRTSKVRGGSGYVAATIFLLIFIVAFFSYAPGAFGSFGEGLKFLKSLANAYIGTPNWLFVFLFATVPFFIALFSSNTAFRAQSDGWMQRLFHSTMTFVSILAIATPLAPSSLMRPYGVLPVAACAFATMTVGYLVVYWYLQFKAVRLGRAEDSARGDINFGRIIALVCGGIYAVALLFSSLLNLFTFDRNAGAFADKVADRILADLGDRIWFVTDGTLDDHLRFAARRSGRELNLICLQRDLDKKYLADLSELVKAKELGGEKNNDLVISLSSFGVLTFMQDWLSVDPAAAKAVAVFGSPDLLYAAKIKPIPELLFFGADPARTPDWGAWPEFDQLLSAPHGWGSYRLWTVKNPLDRMRLNLRRHLGLIANNRGVWLQDEGKPDEAFEMYERVLNEIDTDNVCALFNEFELARAGNKKALAKKTTIERALKAIVDDENRRYRLWTLANYYGYIRSPEIFMKLGFAWARSGRPGEALQQIHRAIDLVPTDKRTAFINMMAALYANENEQGKSRELYESVLAKDANNHDALIGLMRLELLEGNSEKALTYLEQATEAAGDDPRLRTEVALLHMMRGELDQARELLRQVTDANRDNLQAWSLLGAVTIQKIDATKDEKEKAALMKYLEDVVLATMEKQARSSSDYHLQTTRAFILLRKKEDRRREARDAFIAASRARPDITATAEIILDLDIALNDTVDAERQAREVLRRNRKAPRANYVMGSLALQNGRMEEAEMFLRRAADAQRPDVLALNDLAEVLRRKKNFQSAEKYARRAVAAAPKLYVAWETLGAILLDSKGDLNEAEECVKKACELSKDKNGKEADVRMLITLARVQLARGETARGKGTLRKVKDRLGELSEFERHEFEELRKSAR